MFQRSSETREEAGTSNVYLDKDSKCVFGGFVIRGKKIRHYNPLFFKYMLMTYNARKSISTLSNGSTRYNVSQETLSKSRVYIPITDEEQKKIANFLYGIDIKIELLDQKLEALKLFKKGYVQKTIINEKYDYSCKLKRVLKERKTYAVNNGNFVHCSLSKDGVNPKRKKENREFLVRDVNKKYKITLLDDICYNPANLKFGVICKNTYGKGIFSPIYVTFEVNSEFYTDFISLIVTNSSVIKKMRKYEEGTIYERMAVKLHTALSENTLSANIEQLNCRN